MSLVKIQTLRDSFVKRLKEIKKTTNGLSPVDCKQINAILDAVSNDNITATQLGAAALLPISNPTFDLYQINPLKSKHPIDSTCFQFGQGNLGWYFMYGHMESLGFNIILFRIELGTPKTNFDKQIKNPADACIYGLTGGYGKRNGPWITIPHFVFRGNYACGDNGSFVFDALPDKDSTGLKSFSLIGNDGVIDSILEFVDASGIQRSLNANLTKKKDPIYQGKDGCVPCIGGVGTLYWSYTSMDASATTDVGFASNGNGWFDHQWMGIGQTNTTFLRILQNIETTLNTPKLIRWFWLTLQLPNDIQYMIAHTLDNLPKVNDTYSITATKISGNNVQYNVKGSATINAMVRIQNSGQSFPTSYTIKIDNNTYNLQAAFGNSIVYLPAGTINWEGPADVSDVNNNRITGATGFIEGNNLNTEDNLISQTATLAKINPSKFNLFKKKKTLFTAGLLSFIILFSVIILVIALFYYFIKLLFRK